jgi:hypothetical protein
MALIFTFAPETAAETSESNPALFGMVKLSCFTFFAFAISPSSSLCVTLLSYDYITEIISCY